MVPTLTPKDSATPTVPEDSATLTPEDSATPTVPEDSAIRTQLEG